MRIRALVIIAAAVALPVLAFAQDPAGQAFSDAMQKMMDSMHMESTGDPDKAFVTMMIPHHQGAIDMAKVELQYGDDPQIRELAEKIIAAQEQEIAEMESWPEEHP